MRNPFRYFNSSPEIIRLTVMMYVRYPLSLRQVEDLLFERGIDICHETVRFWWNRFGPLFAAEIRKRRIQHRFFFSWRWHFDEVFVRIVVSAKPRERRVCLATRPNIIPMRRALQRPLEPSCSPSAIICLAPFASLKAPAGRAVRLATSSAADKKS